MTTHAHAPKTALTIARPPYVQRRCIALTNPQPARRVSVQRDDGSWGYEWVDGREPQQCACGATPWLPEVDYCATHVPADALLIIRERMSFWDDVQMLMWERVCAEHPYP